MYIGSERCSYHYCMYVVFFKFYSYIQNRKIAKLMDFWHKLDWWYLLAWARLDHLQLYLKYSWWWFCMIYCVKLTFKSHSFQLSIHAQFSMFENKIVTYLKKRFQIFQSFIYIFFKSTEYRILPITAGSYPNQFFKSLDPYHFTVGHFESKWCKKIQVGNPFL